MKQLVQPILTIIVICLLFSCKKINDIDSYKLLKQNKTNTFRYRDSVFASVDTSTFFNILYRVVGNYNGNENLYLDAYLPAGDTATRRAAIIFMHGGAFDTTGNRKDPIIVAACQDFAERGFVAISISYRKGKDFKAGQTYIDSLTKFFEGVYRAAQDARAAIRFIKKASITGKIDSNKIFIGGFSAGATTAMNAAYLQQDEIDNSLGHWGPLDGKTLYDYPGYSNKVKGVINLEAGISDTNFIDRGDAPVISAFGTQDEYFSDSVTVTSPGYPSFGFYNGQSIHKRMANLSIDTSPIILFPGKRHGAHNESAILRNTCKLTAEWMYKRLQQ